MVVDADILLDWLLYMSHTDLYTAWPKYRMISINSTNATTVVMADYSIRPSTIHLVYMINNPALSHNSTTATTVNVKFHNIPRLSVALRPKMPLPTSHVAIWQICTHDATKHQHSSKHKVNNIFPPTIPRLLVNFLTSACLKSVKFPDTSGFSRQVVTLFIWFQVSVHIYTHLAYQSVASYWRPFQVFQLCTWAPVLEKLKQKHANFSAHMSLIFHRSRECRKKQPHFPRIYLVISGTILTRFKLLFYHKT